MGEQFSDRLLEPLRYPPLKQRGFDERLMERIMRELEAGRTASGRRRRPFAFALFLAGFAAVLAVLWVKPAGMPAEHEPAGRPAAQVDAEGLPSAAARDHAFADGLLLGLRSDVPSPASGRYRTLWIAPEGGGLGLVAEVDGILVPYRLDFWLIGEEPAEDGGSRLFAGKVTPGSAPGLLAKASRRPDGGEELGGAAGERLEFAGQSYVVLTRHDGNGRETLLTDLASLASGERRRLSPDEIAPLPEGEAERAGAKWSVVRREGRWTVRTERAAVPLSARASVHDGLCVPWTDVREAVPGAVDAFCSPGGSWTAVLTDDAVVALPVYEDGTLGGRALELPLDAAAKPVMAEWATDGYVAKWTAFLAAHSGKDGAGPGL